MKYAYEDLILMALLFFILGYFINNIEVFLRKKSRGHEGKHSGHKNGEIYYILGEKRFRFSPPSTSKRSSFQLDTKNN